MRYKSLFLIFILLFTLCFSACRLEEEIKFNNDYSGKLRVTINYNDFIEEVAIVADSLESGKSTLSDKDLKKAFIASLKEDSDNFTPPREELDSISDELDGISNINAYHDFNRLKFNFEFEFDDLKAVTFLYDGLAEEFSSAKVSQEEQCLTLKNKALSYNYGLGQLVVDELREGLDGEFGSFPVYFASYSLKITFPDRINTVDNHLRKTVKKKSVTVYADSTQDIDKVTPLTVMFKE